MRGMRGIGVIVGVYRQVLTERESSRMARAPLRGPAASGPRLASLVKTGSTSTDHVQRFRYRPR